MNKFYRILRNIITLHFSFLDKEAGVREKNKEKKIVPDNLS